MKFSGNRYWGVILFLLPFFQATGQHLEYDIHWLGKIGKLHIEKSESEDSVNIITNSVVKIPFYTFNWVTSTTTKNGKLKRADYQQLLNNKKREFTEISDLEDGKWKFVDNEGKESLIEISNPFFVSRLYFQEPVNINTIFSERFGTNLRLINHGNGHYKLLLPDDNYCEYFYEKGVCKIVKAKNGRRTIKMILSKVG